MLVIYTVIALCTVAGFYEPEIITKKLRCILLFQKLQYYLYILAFSTTDYDLVFICPTFLVYSALANHWSAFC